MTTQTIIHDLRGPCAKAFEKTCALDTRPASRPGDLAGRMDEKEKSRKRTTLWEILFHRPWEQNSHGGLDEEMRPFVVSMLGGSYPVADSHRSLAAAAHAGPVSSLAEVRQNTVK